MRAILAEADLTLDRAISLNPTDADCYLERARIDLVAARQELAKRGNPAAALTAGARALDRAEAINPREPELFLARARVEAARAEWTLAAGRDPGPAVRSGLAAAARAEAISPLGGRCRAAAGALHLLAARGATDPERRRNEAREAVKLLEEALSMNRLFAREYGPILADARALAGG